MVKVDSGSKTALSTDLKNEPEQLGVPSGDYASAQKRLNTSYMNQRAGKQFRENTQVGLPKDQKTDGQVDVGSNPSVKVRVNKSELRSKQRSSGDPTSLGTSQ